jgi:hypothetical protein
VGSTTPGHHVSWPSCGRKLHSSKLSIRSLYLDGLCSYYLHKFIFYLLLQCPQAEPLNAYKVQALYCTTDCNASRWDHPSGAIENCPNWFPSPRLTSLLGKPPVMQLLKNFPILYGNRRFITAFKKALHWFLTWARYCVWTYNHLVLALWRSNQSHF